MIHYDYLVQAVGLLAAAATICAFCCRGMLRLRAAAIVANVLFIVYGAMLMLVPVLALHLILLPLNIMRLSTGLRENRTPRCLPSRLSRCLAEQQPRVRG